MKILENEENIKRIIFLNNYNNLVLVKDKELSFFIKIDLSYEKFNNNYIKDDIILESCKLSGNKFCYLTNERIFVLYNKDFSLKSKYLNFGLASYFKHIIFQISNDEIVLVYKFKFIIFNINSFEIQLIFEVGFIYCATSFNEKGLNDDNDNDNDNYIYQYLAVIIKEFNDFYLKIFNFSSHDIKEIEKMKLNENNFKGIFVENPVFKCKTMYYDYNDKGELILIINYGGFSPQIITIDLNKLKYI